MPLPDLIEIDPLPAAPNAQVTVPGSKSITNRALVLAALADGSTTLRGALWSEDTQVMVSCLQTLGFDVAVEPDPGDPANRTIRVVGQGGRIPRGGTAEQPLSLHVGNAGTAARFLSAMVCLGPGAYRLSGVPRMHQRPQAALLQALRSLGYRVEAPNDRLPAVIHGQGGPRPGVCHVSIAESSQFASALLLAAPRAGWEVMIDGTADGDEAPYVAMTTRLAGTFPARGGIVDIEPDASSGSYFWAADWLLRGGRPTPSGSSPVARWPESGWQVDARFPGFLPLPPEVSRERHLGDSIMTAIVLGPFAGYPVRFTDLGRLRVQECERVAALREGLARCGADVHEEGDTLTVLPSALHGAEIETHDDHRVAMCFATLALHVPGLRIRNPACVRKTFPNFFQKLAAPAPNGLGAMIRDARTGRRLEGDSLLAT
ncbi:MAG: 3-phosphoshikimate 1-carboxyvinyltransferase [Verrucomicrobiota bacterium]|jgi:3-phosphoshikimate 1-carboxyvinyltransferase